MRLREAILTREQASMFKCRFIAIVLASTCLAACAPMRTIAPDRQPPMASAIAEQLVPFSAHPAGVPPAEWEPLIILRDRKPTVYRLVDGEGDDGKRTVLHAFASQSSSALMHILSIRPEAQPWMRWEWRLGPTRLTGGDPSERGSPGRIVLGFGDKGTLPFTDQILFETGRVLTGHEFPYATLMYVWAENLPVGTVVHSRHSNRIRMVVVDSGSQGIGRWRTFARNIAEDFERAFGEKPGKLLGVGVLTDSQNDDASTEAWYGDISLSETPPAEAPGPVPVSMQR